MVINKKIKTKYKKETARPFKVIKSHWKKERIDILNNITLIPMQSGHQIDNLNLWYQIEYKTIGIEKRLMGIKKRFEVEEIIVINEIVQKKITQASVSV